MKNEIKEAEHKIIQRLLDEMYYFNIGNHYEAFKFMGAKASIESNQVGYRFTVWAPNAKQVYVEGSFNDWQEVALNKIADTGGWSIFIPNVKEWALYKFVIEDQHGVKKEKQDPFAFAGEVAPKNASVIQNMPTFEWTDKQWLTKRKQTNVFAEPINIYELHMSSWRKHADGTSYSFADLERELIPYVLKMGYTHIEFMPLMDHPLEASWGYQISGYFSIAGRFGHDFGPLMSFVNACHHAGIGVLVDWVPGHFIVNDDALANFDGTPTYEFQDPNRAVNNRWGTKNFDLGRKQVQSFLISSAIFWLESFHFDGIRVDAVSNMLYLDYDIGPWTPNKYGNNVNLEGVEFLRKLNNEIFLRDPSYLMIAEESTAWDGVTKPTSLGGLGFNFKWNMGWMNDTLKFFGIDPIGRKHNYKLVNFTFMYMHDENFILPFSHDEVVHGKDSLLGKMPNPNRYEQFANLRVLEGYHLLYPGKKLSFMGNEIGQFLEWRFYDQLEWDSLNRPYNSEFQHYIATLNQLYKDKSALHELDTDKKGIDIVEADDEIETTLSFIRKGKKTGDVAVCAFNFTPVERQKYRIGVPFSGSYKVIFNSEMKEFGGNWETQTLIFETVDVPHKYQPYSIEITLPSLAAIVLEPDKVQVTKKHK
ncbi:1,4-alpha-glucan branching protein GlgB [Aerococcus agrisoli]|uniref:1,4-alpha-glucan branching enzyme GlgB n=1 Tax=Aerococcus agrisoli TaxID=2487350 RepID=A0A3N4G9H2_9LACT|nr:1,4-alpha-glucan branching protein GlgB [Aerococcus agrisoli]RPA58915.1 1,4-alpha-glucan branching protein GlgB [Aerococcus agrisoli]